MSEEKLREALLKQNGSGHPAGPLDVELAALNRLVDDERHRVRKLTIWTVVVWAVWLLLVAAGFAMPMLAREAAQPDGSRPAATQPAETTQRAETTQPPGAPAHPNRHAGAPGLMGIIIGSLCVAALLGLPLVGVVLLIMMILGRRTATTNQIRASLAELDAKLRLLTAQGAPPAHAEERRSGP